MAEATEHPARAYSTTTTEDLLLSEDRRALSALKKTELADELKLRRIPHTGRKDELITRLIEDNERQRISGTQEPPTTQRATSDVELASIRSLSAANAKLHAEIEVLKSQLQLLSTPNEQREQRVSQRHDNRHEDAETRGVVPWGQKAHLDGGARPEPPGKGSELRGTNWDGPRGSQKNDM
ncbi:hypothetical protein HPB52_011663 [Rhipicephalus sanguineus]|uniref:SAP domain-containing protein n=1 Tax=Rhipicephalus sanguineus TaxID=34632 RepID=A0A9D4T9N1_RHISA|nr:hypothetical protein HPB52_011663 [Rhipicephalus sanguineus]